MNPIGFYVLYHKWFNKMYEDPDFKAKVIDIWKQYRSNILNVNNLIIEESKTIELSRINNFRLWPLFSDPSWCVVPGKTNFTEHLDWLRLFLSQRIDWLDQQFK